MLVLELQDFRSSKVAAACVMASRKILKIHPIWSSDLEKKTKYSDLDLLKCMNILLSNYGELKIGNVKKKTEDIFGKPPHPYEHNKQEHYFDSEIKNTKVKSSISPRKQRRIVKPPTLGGKTKSTAGTSAEAKARRESYYQKYKYSPPSGLLKNRKNRISKDTEKENFGINMKLVQPVFNSDSEDSENGESRKVSFANQVSVQHGSKKLIEQLQDTVSKARGILAKKQYKEDDILQLRKNRSYTGHNIHMDMRNGKWKFLKSYQFEGVKYL